MRTIQKTIQKTMRSKTALAMAFGAILLTANISAAQNAPEPAKYFHLDFEVKELDAGKVVNARHYLTTVSTQDSSGTIRSGSKVPVQYGTETNASFSYIDVGVNIDTRQAKQIESDLALSVTAEISTAVPGPKQPVIRQTKWSANVIVTLGKPTVIFSSDDIAGKGQMQLELTAVSIPAR